MLNKEQKSYKRPIVKHKKPVGTKKISKKLVISVILAILAAAIYSATYKYTADAKRIQQLEQTRIELQLREEEINSKGVDNEEKLKKIQELESQLEEVNKQLQAKLQTKKALAERAPIYAAYTGSNADLYRAAGIPERDWAGIEKIYSQESGVCHLKWQGQYGACPTHYVEKYPGAERDSSIGYGICQSTPAIKMASEGEDWRTNPVTQMRWCYKYTLGYGSVQAAIDFKYCLGNCYSPRTKSYVFKHTPWF